MQRNTVADTAGISGRCRRSHTAAHPSTSGDLAVLPRLAGPRPLFGLRGPIRPNVSRRLAPPVAVPDQLAVVVRHLAPAGVSSRRRRLALQMAGPDQLAGVVRRSRDGGGRTQDGEPAQAGRVGPGCHQQQLAVLGGLAGEVRPSSSPRTAKPCWSNVKIKLDHSRLFFAGRELGQGLALVNAASRPSSAPARANPPEHSLLATTFGFSSSKGPRTRPLRQKEQL